MLNLNFSTDIKFIPSSTDVEINAFQNSTTQKPQHIFIKLKDTSKNILEPNDIFHLYEFYPSQYEKSFSITLDAVRSIQEYINFLWIDSLSSKEQIGELKKILGLNISEIASIFHVSRPTVYEWLESDFIKRTSHQEKLNEIYHICLFWKFKSLGKLGNYLYRKTGAESSSIFDLLKEEKLDIKQIHSLLDKTASFMMKKRLEEESFQQLLEKHNFEKVSTEEATDNINIHSQKIG